MNQNCINAQRKQLKYFILKWRLGNWKINITCYVAGMSRSAFLPMIRAIFPSWRLFVARRFSKFYFTFYFMVWNWSDEMISRSEIDRTCLTKTFWIWFEFARVWINTCRMIIIIRILSDNSSCYSNTCFWISKKMAEFY